MNQFYSSVNFACQIIYFYINKMEQTSTALECEDVMKRLLSHSVGDLTQSPPWSLGLTKKQLIKIMILFSGILCDIHTTVQFACIHTGLWLYNFDMVGTFGLQVMNIVVHRIITHVHY